MSVRLRQGLVVGTGLVIAAVMVFLGLWQMQVFVDQGNRTAADRARQPAVRLLDYVAADGIVGDIYGKQVNVEGKFLPNRHVLIQDANGARRTLLAFALPDGRVLAVAGGMPTEGPWSLPAAAPRTITGIFLPSEARADHPVPPDVLGSVRLPLLAQDWPEQLLPGFVTLDANGAAALGLKPTSVVLPTEDGSWRNGGYALQWWVFAAFGFGMSVLIARNLGRAAEREQEAALRGGR